MNEPLISFVGYTRNDNYVPNFQKRLQTMVSSLAHNAERFSVAVELLLVEWNPPADTDPIASLLDNVTSSPNFSIRIITVPHSYHRGFRGDDEKGIHPIKALNIGYRRAKGRFLSPIASDAVISEEVFQFINDHALDSSKVYRIDRIDVDDSCLNSFDILKFDWNVLRAQITRSDQHVHVPLDEDMVFHYGVLPLHTNACGDFLLMSKDSWHTLRGQRENGDVACLDEDSVALHAAVINGLEEYRLPPGCCVYKFAHNKMSTVRVRPHRTGYRKTLERLINALFLTRPTKAIFRALFDVPRRDVGGLKGTFHSMERNFILPVRYWRWRGKKVHLNARNWGLGDADLPEKIL